MDEAETSFYESCKSSLLIMLRNKFSVITKDKEMRSSMRFGFLFKKYEKRETRGIRLQKLTICRKVFRFLMKSL